MNTISLIISISAIIMSIISLFIGHNLVQKRDLRNKYRETKVQYLITAWRLLENAANRPNMKCNVDLEKAIADIQLFGSNEQIQLAQAFSIEFAKNKNADLKLLLEKLRTDLRAELGFEKAPEKLIILRMSKEA